MGEYIVEGIFNKKEKRYIISKSNLKNTVLSISGAKNSALPVLVASILTGRKVSLTNIPKELNDVQAIFEILTELECSIDSEKNNVIVCSSNLKNRLIKQEIASKTRYSSLLMGALLGRFRRVEIPYPGGCKLGDGRPIDIHLNGLKALGADIVLESDRIILETKTGLVGTTFTLNYPSVGATENLIIAAVLSQGKTILKNCASEPEVSDLAIFLNNCGAKIKGIGTRELIIEGVDVLKECTYCIIPDRIEIGTFIALCVTGKSKLVLAPVIYKHVESFIEKFKEMGVKFVIKDDILEIDATGPLKPVDIVTDVYPAIPTDMQPIFSSALVSVKGKSSITETVYRNRFAQVPELVKMGAVINVDGQKLIINGGNQLKGTSVYSHDLRAGASLLIAAVLAEGTTELLNVEQIERGYSYIVEKIRKMGINIEVI